MNRTASSLLLNGRRCPYPFTHLPRTPLTILPKSCNGMSTCMVRGGEERTANL